MTTNFDFDDDTTEEEVVVEEAPARRSSPLRLILLVLLILALLCVVCFFLGPRLGLSLPIPGLGGGEPAPVEPVVTEEPVAENGEQLPVEGTTEAVVEPGQEAPVTEEPVTGEEPLPTEETEQPLPEGTEEVPVEPEPEQPAEPEPEQPSDGVIDEHGEDIIQEPTPPGTSEPVPGPTSTPGPTVVITPESCENNQPPVANAGGPYNAMMGKGQAFVTFDGSGSSDSDGNIIKYEWDFGDGSDPGEGETVVHGYTGQGTYEATLTVTDDCGNSATTTAQVTIIGPTPPATGTPGTATPAPTGEPSASTLGFCYVVQPGNTLTGIAWAFGVPLLDLARVNNVWPEYYVRAGESLFVPTGEIVDGPNAYQVEQGDTIYSVAWQCGLSAGYLAQVNNLDIDATLTPGQFLIIPLSRW